MLNKGKLIKYKKKIILQHWIMKNKPNILAHILIDFIQTSQIVEIIISMILSEDGINNDIYYDCYRLDGYADFDYDDF